MARRRGSRHASDGRSAGGCSSSDAKASTSRVPGSRAASAWPPLTSARPTSSSGRSSPAAKGCSPKSSSREFKLLRDRVPAESLRRRACRRRDKTCGRPLEDVFADVRPRAARGGLDRAGARGHAAHRRGGRREGPAATGRASSSARTSRRCRGSPRTWSAASRSPRSPTRPRSSSCSRRRSSRSSTSGSKPRTCSTSRACCTEPGQRGYVVPRPHPKLVTRRVLVMERLSRLRVRRRREHARRRHRHRRAVIRTGMVAFMEGALIYGIFHGDLHGGNLFVLPDGRTALLDFGITGRLERAAAARVPAADDRCDDERHQGPARRAARPRRAPRRHRPRRGDPRPRASTSRRSTRRRCRATSWSTRSSAR